MKIIGAIFLLIVFVSSIYAQGLFDQAEIEFDVDYIDIGNVQILGSKAKGQVMVVWMKSGSVLTKTLSNSKIKYSDDEDVSYSYDRNNVGWQESKFTKDKVSMEALNTYSLDELTSRANDLINDWGDHTTYRLFDMLFSLVGNDKKGPECVQFAMDIITAHLEHGFSTYGVGAERRFMLKFAEGDEQLTKMANDFLEEKGFNKEN